MTLLFLCGDVMTGRGIDQILPYPSDPRLFEPYVADAREYVALAESAHGTIPRDVDGSYIWGDALGEIEARRPQARIINLEISVTASDHAWDKGIHYRMHPRNVACLSAAGLDETLATLHAAGLATARADSERTTAEAPAVLPLNGNARLLISTTATGDSGVPPDWAAGPHQPGISRLPDRSPDTVQHLRARIEAYRRPDDLVLVSAHWGGNWRFRIAPEQRAFARALVDEAGVDLIHGHSSHHIRGLEIHAGLDPIQVR